MKRSNYNRDLLLQLHIFHIYITNIRALYRFLYHYIIPATNSSYVTRCSNVCIMDVIRQTNLSLSTSSHLNNYRTLSIVVWSKIAYLTFVLKKMIIMVTTNYAFPTYNIPIQRSYSPK